MNEIRYFKVEGCQTCPLRNKENDFCELAEEKTQFGIDYNNDYPFALFCPLDEF